MFWGTARWLTGKEFATEADPVCGRRELAPLT